MIHFSSADTIDGVTNGDVYQVNVQYIKMCFLEQQIMMKYLADSFNNPDSEF